MTEKTTQRTRRTLLKGLAAAPLAVALGHQRIAFAAKLSVDDPQAKALGYTEKSAKDGQHCANCALWQGGDAAMGKCQIFGDKEVMAAGWCNSWAAAG